MARINAPRLRALFFFTIIVAFITFTLYQLNLIASRATAPRPNKKRPKVLHWVRK